MKWASPARSCPRKTRPAVVTPPRTTRSPIRKTTATMCSRLPTSCAPPKRRRAARSRRRFEPASRCSARSAARPATSDSVTTAPAGTSINGGALIVPPALGNRTIHPYSDFLLHDIGTGDGIPIQPTQEFMPTREPDSDGAAVGAAHPQPPDARRPVVHAGGSDPASRRAGVPVTSRYRASVRPTRAIWWRFSIRCRR